MTKKYIFGAIVVVVAIGAFFIGKVLTAPGSPTAPVVAGLTNQLAEQYDPYIKYAGGYNSALPIQTTSTVSASGGFLETALNAVNQFLGLTVTNNLIQGALGYSTTFNTAVAATSTFTPSQFCSTTDVLVPVSATTSTGIVFPNATTTYTACGVTAPGSWETQIVENESSFPMIIATTSTGWTFLYNSTTTAKLPVIVPASTTATFIGIPTSASSWLINIDYYSHATGQ